ncbi:MAG TPA: alkaline phosphatase family protein [Streptosporangiaceae bacterium]|nr:alkaline phosphatase family protein [Streptosporangiaceae bacterium]
MLWGSAMPIEHVVVLCLENRSFDHMLGFLQHPSNDFNGLLQGGPYTNMGWDGHSRVPVTAKAKRVLPFGPDHSHDAVMEQLSVKGRGPARRATNDGFVTSYERKARGLAPAQLGGVLGPVLNSMQQRKQAAAPKAKGRGPLVMLCQDPDQVPVLSKLALEFAVCDQWFCSVPGETWPNRNYLHAATSDGETDIEIRAYTDRTIFELLEEDAKATWRIYYDDTPQVWAFPALWDTPARHENWYPTGKFAEHVASGDLPNYSFIEPNHRPPLHTLDHNPLFNGAPDVSDSQHPENNLVSNKAYDGFDQSKDTDFARGEGLIATIYETLRGNPQLFARTLLLITYDEHGGLYDHVPPPTGVPAPDDGRGAGGDVLHVIWHRKAKAFDFTMLGPRVPAILVSPLIDAGTIDHRVHDHASVPATLRALFAPGAKPLTRRDAWATPFHDLASRDTPRTDLPDLSAYQPEAPAPALAAKAEAVAAATAAPDTSPAAVIPEYYQEFLKQADAVRQHLTQVGEPEIAAATAQGQLQRAAQTSQAFQQAAHRHRHPG